MKTEDFYFELPESLIAQHPLENREDSRLLVPHQGAFEHVYFRDLPRFLRPNDLLVVNDSKVIPARFFGKKPSGGQVEFLVERLLSEHEFLTHMRASKGLPLHSVIHVEGAEIEVIGRVKSLYHCRSTALIRPLLDKIGEMPLPPYISRTPNESDKTRYQTVYANYEGSVAAPTAGLHFDEAMLRTLKEQGIKRETVTLHVGSGTFKPVRAVYLKDHEMHSEYCEVSREVVDEILETKKQGGRVIAVGTTALRSLESAAQGGNLLPFAGETDIFIYPGFQFRVCDGLITNFHLPASTLMMLVSAFIGYEEAKALYQEAIRLQYRFFSYGDTSLLWRKE